MSLVVSMPQFPDYHWFVQNIFLGLQPYSDPEEERRGPGDLYGLVFQNISIAAPSVLGEPDILWGMSDGLIYDLIFDNVVIGNETIKNIDHFYHNEFVFNWKFVNNLK